MEFLSNYWQILITISGVIISFTTLKTQNAEQERRIKDLEDELKIIKSDNKNIDVKLAEIQKDIQWIKQALSK